MTGRSLDVLTAGVEYACRTISGPVALQRAVAAALREAVPFDAWCVLTIDPASVLPTGGFHRDGLPLEYMPKLLEIEARGDDALALPVLAHDGRRAMTLHAATGGRPEQSPRYQEILVPAGMTHEMRVLFSTNANVWGALMMFRASDAPDFTEAEAGLAGDATVSVAEAIRREMVLTEIAADTATVAGPGLLLLNPELDRISATSSAPYWLAQVDDDIDPRRELPFCVLNLAQQAWSRPGPARSRIRTRTGRWLTLHAEHLTGADQVSIILEATRPVEIAELVADTYRLTSREREVVGLLARGHSRTEIARLLTVSAHTVDDHLKRLFGKLGVRSRAELTAKLFFDQHAPRIQNEVPVGGTGWFLH